MKEYTIAKPLSNYRQAWYDRLWNPSITQTIYATAADYLSMPEASCNSKQEILNWPRTYLTLWEVGLNGQSMMNKVAQLFYKPITGCNALDYPMTTFTWRPFQYTAVPAALYNDIAYDLNLAWFSPVHSYIVCDRLPIIAGIVTNPGKSHYALPSPPVAEDDFIRATPEPGFHAIQTYAQETSRCKPYKGPTDDKTITTQVALALFQQGLTRSFRAYHQGPTNPRVFANSDLEVYCCGGFSTFSVGPDGRNQPFMLPVRKILVYNQRIQQYTSITLPGQNNTLSILGLPITTISIAGTDRGSLREDSTFEVIDSTQEMYEGLLSTIIDPIIPRDSGEKQVVREKTGAAAESGLIVQ